MKQKTTSWDQMLLFSTRFFAFTFGLAEIKKIYVLTERLRKKIQRENCEFDYDEAIRAKFSTHNIKREFCGIDRCSIQVVYV